VAASLSIKLLANQEELSPWRLITSAAATVTTLLRNLLRNDTQIPIEPKRQKINPRDRYPFQPKTLRGFCAEDELRSPELLDSDRLGQSMSAQPSNTCSRDRATIRGRTYRTFLHCCLRLLFRRRTRSATRAATTAFCDLTSHGLATTRSILCMEPKWSQLIQSCLRSLALEG